MGRRSHFDVAWEPAKPRSRGPLLLAALAVAAALMAIGYVNGRTFGPPGLQPGVVVRTPDAGDGDPAGKAVGEREPRRPKLSTAPRVSPAPRQAVQPQRAPQPRGED